MRVVLGRGEEEALEVRAADLGDGDLVVFVGGLLARVLAGQCVHMEENRVDKALYTRVISGTPQKSEHR